MTNEELIEALRAVDAVRFGTFELSHGGTSDYYVDKYRFETDPAALSAVADAFAEKIERDHEEEKLAGVALGAVPLAAATSIATHTPYVIVRKAAKEYGTANQIEGHLDAGERVLVLEDIATTGQSALDAIEALREVGATVEHILVVVDRQEGARELLSEHDIELSALLTADELLDAGE